VAAVSPLIGGRAVKGPTDAFLTALGRPHTGAGIASLYTGLLDAIVVDPADPGPPPEGVRVEKMPTLMEGAAGRRTLAERVLKLAREI
jgi:LPPG:FO 2-phospho-L-lactate transferase